MMATPEVVAMMATPEVVAMMATPEVVVMMASPEAGIHAIHVLVVADLVFPTVASPRTTSRLRLLAMSRVAPHSAHDLSTTPRTVAVVGGHDKRTSSVMLMVSKWSIVVRK